jgi:hypothetical protein
MTYSRLSNIYDGKNLLEITPSKKNNCRLFPDQQLCKDNQSHLSNCPSGFKGRPYKFEYTPIGWNPY